MVFWKEDLKAARAMGRGGAAGHAMDDLTRESMNRFIRRSCVPSDYGGSGQNDEHGASKAD